MESVVLSDGTVINTGHTISGITYTAYDVSETYSLFRSEFNLRYNLYGYQQENTINCWSLGCVYAAAGVPHYTCIVKGNKVLVVNTSFTWSLPGITPGGRYTLSLSEFCIRVLDFAVSE